MVQFEFDEQIGRLKRAYGQQVNEEIVTMLWRRFGPVSHHVFVSVVDHMIEEKAPLKISTMSELVNSKSRAARRGHEAEPSDEEKYPCSICSTAGTMFAETHDRQYRIFIRCSCAPWGSEVVDKDLPQWSPKMARDFTLVKIPSMRPDISAYKNLPDVQKQSDEDFINDPRMHKAIQEATKNSQDWWRQQKLAALYFWKNYFQEGMSR